MSEANEILDAVVIGGGPAGSAVATLLAKENHRVRLYERAEGPRFHVGESLIPMTYWVLRRMGVLEQLERSHFPRKYSVQFVTADGKETRPFYFFETNPHESAATWQVRRDEFDDLLLRNAESVGCDVRRGTGVAEVVFEGEGENARAVGVRTRGAENQLEFVRSRVVVDATGQSALVANRLGLKEPNPYLRQASVWTYFRGARCDAGIDGGATIILSTKGQRGWFWYIPLPDGITSVGAVSTLDYLLGAGEKPENAFASLLNECPALGERLENAEQVDRFHVTQDFSYVSKQAAGNGWVLVGDAFGFLDPVYSTGLLLALKSGELAADAIHEGLERNDLSARQLGRWEPVHRRAIDAFKKLVYAFYSYDFSFGRFVREHPEHRERLVDLLVGDVYKDGFDEFFEAVGALRPYDSSPPTAADRAVEVSA